MPLILVRKVSSIHSMSHYILFSFSVEMKQLKAVSYSGRWFIFIFYRFRPIILHRVHCIILLCVLHAKLYYVSYNKERIWFFPFLLICFSNPRELCCKHWNKRTGKSSRKENFLVVWLNQNHDDIREEKRDLTMKLRPFIQTVKGFTDIDECIDFVTDIISGGFSYECIYLSSLYSWETMSQKSNHC